MRNFFKRWYFLLLAILLLVVFFPWMSNITSISDDGEVILDPKASPYLSVDDSLPYYKYKPVKDSFDRVEQCRKSKYTNPGTGMYGWPLGYTHIREADVCTDAIFNKAWEKDHYYLALQGYRVSPDAKFLIEDDKYYLGTVVRDTSNGNKSRMAKYEYKELNIRFLSDGPVGTYTGKGSVLVPVSKSIFDLSRVFLNIYFILLLLGFLSLIILGISVLISIARGQVFTRSNIRKLSVIGWSFVGFCLFIPLLSYLFYWIFHNRIPAGIDLSFSEIVQQGKSSFVVGLIIILIARAFKKGYELKSDNESIV